ncbi:MAG: 6-phosphogluconolactonase [Bacteroidales bacterium]|nr:6-phosphogluconolactonase [Bacteroidales bacterium]
MYINVLPDAKELGEKAAELAAIKIAEAVRLNGEARMIVATGASQFEAFQALVRKNIPWQKVEVFHLDEYIGIPSSHPASFRKYLYERFISLVPVKRFHSVDVEGDIKERIKDLTVEIRKRPVDVGMIGIGVNGHIAFNDPPADFDTREAYIVVRLDDECKMQQVNEGWFRTIEDVPGEALSMSVWQIMQCRTIISCVPHSVKAEAVYRTLTGRISNMVPATMLKKHPDLNLFLDYNSVSKLIPFS